MNKPKIIFMGTPHIAMTALNALYQKYDVCLVVSQPDKKKDRKGNFVYSAVKQYCLTNNIPLVQPIKVKEVLPQIQALNPDLIVTCAYGQFIPSSILAIPKYKCVNLHASLLPRWRGAAPMQWAILSGDTKTGLTLMYMDKLMDHGNIIATIDISLVPLKTNYSELYALMENAVIEMINTKFDDLFNDNVISQVQDESLVTLAPMITKEQLVIDWDQDGKAIINHINAFANEPLATTYLNDCQFKIAQAIFTPTEHKNEGIANGTVIKCDKQELIVKVKDGTISILQIQVQNKKMLPIKAFLNGNNLVHVNDQFKKNKSEN